MSITTRRLGRNDSPVSAEQLRAALTQLTQQALGPVTATLALLYTFYSAAYAAQLSVRGAHFGLGMSAVTALAFAGLWLRVSRWPMPSRFVNPLGAAIGLVVGLNCLLCELATRDAELSANLLICIVAIPLFLLDTGWLVALIGTLVAGWVSVQAYIRTEQQWQMQTYPMIASVVVAGLFFAVRRQTHRRLEETRLELRHMALRDELTGARNRRGFSLAAAEHLHEAADDAVLLFVDVDGLKSVNDTSGHAAGDALLRDAADVITSAFPRSITGRIGGDEFAVLVRAADCGGPEAARDALLAHLRTTTASRSALLPRLSLSVGTAFARATDREDLEQLLLRADRDMYDGRNDRRRRASGAA